MKKALVLSLLVVFGAALVDSAQLTGEWDTWLKLNISSFGLDSFYSYLDVSYSVGGWTLSADTVLDKTGLSQLWFEGIGALGAFNFWSLAVFNPSSTTPAFMEFDNGAEVSIAGVDIYALFAIAPVDGKIGTGFAFGGIGTAGDIRIGAEVTFNLDSQLWGIFLYGLNGWVTDWTWTYCAAVGGTDVWNPIWLLGSVPSGLAPLQSDCAVVFSYVTAVAQFPICCADVYVFAAFSCAKVFENLSFLAKNVDIGIPWLKLYQLGITYDIDGKTIGTYFQVNTGDVVCFKPYFTVNWTGTEIQGITLNALTLSCTLGGCEFYWGHIFENTMSKVSGSYWITNPLTNEPGFAEFYFLPLGGGLSRYDPCYWYVLDGETEIMPNEVFGVQCDEDSCCGGLFSFGISNFFSTTADVKYIGIFGWMGTYIELHVGVGSNVNLIGGINVTAFDAVDALTFGVNVAW